VANDVKGSVNITIGANADVLNKVFDDAQKRANSFSRNLSAAAALGAAAFFSLRDGVIGSVQAFAESEAASRKLDAALKNQGILTDELQENYSRLADQLSLLTGADDDAVTSMLAAGQAFLGTTEITSELTKSIADLSAGMGIELGEAFEKVTKTIGTNTNALAKQGIQVDESMTKQERMAAIIEQINARYAGQAQAAQTVGTAIASMGVQFGNLREEIGRRFAPIVEKVTAAFTGFIREVLARPEILDFIANVALGATALTGLIAGIMAVKAAFLVLSPVIALVTSPFLLWPTLIAGVIGAGYLLIKHFDNLGAAFRVFVGELGTLGSGAIDVLTGIFTLNPKKFGEGLDQITAYFKNGMAALRSEAENAPAIAGGVDSEAAAKQLEANRKLAAQREADQQAHNQRLQEIERNKTEAILLQNEVGSKALIDLKNQESAIIKQIDEEAGNTEIGRNQERLNALREQLEQNLTEQERVKQEHLERMVELQASFNQAEVDAKALGFQADMEFTRQQQDQLYQMALSEREAKRQVGFEMVKDQIERNNQFLTDQARFGETYAKLNQTLNSREVQGAKTAADELIGLTQSKNATLKAIGKAAAVTQIGISTAEAAMNVYKSLSGIPLIGPALAVSGALAAVAFGAERTAQVVAANQGGVVPGYGPNVDSVPAMLSPGEIVIPKPLAPTFAEQFSGGGMGEVVAELQALRGEISGARPSVVVQGDMLTDDVFIDRLIAKISDRLEFGNARLVGVNA
jgi:hypothetical protein